MQVKKSDLCDRLTILRMKIKLDKKAEAEYKLFEKEVFSKVIPAGGNPIVLLLLDLMEANAKTWENEAAIRKEYTKDSSNTLIPDTSLSEIGRRAILIREHNKLRLKAKAEIDKMFNELSDTKVDHASQ